MALTIANKKRVSLGNAWMVSADVTFDSSYALGGESFTLNDFGLSNSIYAAFSDNVNGYELEIDRSGLTIAVNDKPWVDTSATITDNDSASSAGVAVYVHVDEVSEQGSARAHLEFVSPTNADGTGTAYNGGPTYYIQDDDNAATGGVALYFDEDATLGSRLLANTGRNCYVDIGGGRTLKVTHNATPGTPGVQVYFDEDAANSYGRLQFVSPTNASGSETTRAEVDSATDLSGLTARVTLVGI